VFLFLIIVLYKASMALWSVGFAAWGKKYTHQEILAYYGHIRGVFIEALRGRCNVNTRLLPRGLLFLDSLGCWDAMDLAYGVNERVRDWWWVAEFFDEVIVHIWKKRANACVPNEC
jgi:hypothetical protein